ncbi:MAG: arginine deiminase-related protein [Planctomycetota bacterium]
MSGVHTDPKEFAEAYMKIRRRGPVGPSTMSAALLVAPHGLRVSEQSARDNLYMADGTIDRERAHEQHARVARKLSDLGVPVITFPGIKGQDDGVFPNNVFATTQDRLIVGSMYHEVRRREASRPDIRQFFSARGYEIHDLSEGSGFAELTGSLIIDQAHQVGFCGLSNRTDSKGCLAMHGAFGLQESLQFELAEGEYHTNIVLSILGGRVAVFHPPSFRDERVAQALRECFGNGILELSDEEKEGFAGNCLAITDRDVLLSSTAFRSLRETSLATLDREGFRVHDAEIDELEKAGGSLRCLIAEVF